ncbi:MBL fold metallo-hydrolase [uncultured Rhodoblastus sp.]|uniref:MBL fold metallo-hydrolase n=1 Tax=uncultured Rhodoblastus sp. TaxID=543037 RepID=UPI0025E4501F|nr:MBL fold metallo-hydrolase [uncultured Rhodoblastus sp.]
MTRRDAFFRAAAATSLLCGCGCDAFAAAMEDPENSTRGPPVKDQPLKPIGPHVFMIQAPDGFPTPENQGFMSNVTFVAGHEGVIVIDSGASLQIAEMAIRQLRAFTHAPVIGVVNTHYHGDHWLGNHGFVEAFGKDLPLYAHPGTRRAIDGAVGPFWRDSMLKWTDQASAGTRIAAPNRDIDHGFTLDLGDVTLRCHHYCVAHTPADILVEVVEDGVLCAGDVVMDRRIANMDDGSYLGTFATLDALAAHTKTKIWLPAHGSPGAGVERWQRELFEGIYRSCAEAVKQGVPLEGAMAFVMKDPGVSSRAQETRGWERNIGKYVSLAYLEAEQAQF